MPRFSIFFPSRPFPSVFASPSPSVRPRLSGKISVLLNVWGKDDYFLGRSMDVFITKLRKYFKADTSVHIETIHGMGFRLNAAVE